MGHFGRCSLVSYLLQYLQRAPAVACAIQRLVLMINAVTLKKHFGFDNPYPVYSFGQPDRPRDGTKFPESCHLSQTTWVVRPQQQQLCTSIMKIRATFSPRIEHRCSTTAWKPLALFCCSFDSALLWLVVEAPTAYYTTVQYLLLPGYQSGWQSMVQTA